MFNSMFKNADAVQRYNKTVNAAEYGIFAAVAVTAFAAAAALLGADIGNVFDAIGNTIQSKIN